MDPYRELACAVVMQAIDDYRTAVRNLKQNPRHTESLLMKADCEQFFRSDWYRMFHPLDGETVLRRVREEELKR